MDPTSEPAALAAAIALVPPFLYCLVAVIIAGMFREALSERIRSLRKFPTPFGLVETGEPTNQETATPTAPAEKIDKSQPLKWNPATQSVATVGAIMLPYVSGEKPRNEDVDLALFWFFAIAFESTYEYIYGSQIRLLQALDSAGKLTKAQAMEFYEDSVRLGNKMQAPDQYFNYLSRNKMMTTSADGATYERTDACHGFLQYLTTNRHSLAKIY